ncbi:Trk system potassium transporter TrkA [Alloprevotella sp. Lung230]|jgi:potassium uptake protein trkA|uniref:Trk system potassium transporter TrkA n=1 Tax=Alloprevotella sp. Lung230 TaxID=2766595 RepID=UPI001655AA27|nr:Trk system potassium transporter TrkA [Alloprevotella sp. Lung230]MBC8625960.1 Trk system potassium transporter TrkA [Alloprevotella sp. Lung230]
MKVVIAGAGEVGTHLAKMLVGEHHDITLIDEKQSRLNAVSSNLDILTIFGSPTSISTLQEAGVGRAGLFIGVTPDESRNMTCCMLAKKLGAKKTVARVDELEYTQPDNLSFFQTLGVDSVIYPEQLAAQEINHLIRRPWVRQWWEVQGGQLMLFGVKVRRGVSILNRPLAEFSGPDDPYHITAIKRRGETLIPHGSDCIEEDDLVFVMTTPDHIGLVREILGKADTPEAHTVFYMGGADTVVQSINTLDPKIHVKLFERDPERHLDLSSAIHRSDILMLNGDGRDIDLLRDENIEHAQVFVAATLSSESNILACMAAKRLGVPKTIAMVENTEYIAMAEQLDIGSVLNKKAFAAGHIYRLLLRADVESIKYLSIAQADVIEYKVKKDSRITQKPIKDLHLPSSVNIGGYVRNNRGYLANGNTTFEAGDIVVAFSFKGECKKLEKFFK